MDPPTYPTPDGAAAEDERAPMARWSLRLAVAAVVVAFAVIVILHLTGVVGPTAH